MIFRRRGHSHRTGFTVCIGCIRAYEEGQSSSSVRYSSVRFKGNGPSELKEAWSCHIAFELCPDRDMDIRLGGMQRPAHGGPRKPKDRCSGASTSVMVQTKHLPEPSKRVSPADAGRQLAQGDGGMMRPDAPGPRAPHCSRNELEECDNVDNDCDERVDEDCLCQVPEKPCYPGHPDDLTVPNTACRNGTQACILETYGDCVDFILPSQEVCDGIDNNCNGVVDDANAGCAPNTPPVAVCPPNQFGFPLSNFDLRGGYEDADGDPMARAEWRLTSAPPGSTANPIPAAGLDTQVFVDLQGTYTLELEVEDSRGGIGRCQTELSTDSRDGLRIEMVWNVNAANDTSDVDLHLKRSPNARWFDSGRSGDDCFYRNCKVCDTYNEEQCRAEIAEYNANPNAPPPAQVEWNAPLDNDDPRLDLDDVEGQARKPEHQLSSRWTYRLGVHYYEADGFGPSTVSIRIFCEGGVIEQFGPLVLDDTGFAGGRARSFGKLRTSSGQTATVGSFHLAHQIVLVFAIKVSLKRPGAPAKLEACAVRRAPRHAHPMPASVCFVRIFWPCRGTCPPPSSHPPLMAYRALAEQHRYSLSV